MIDSAQIAEPIHIHMTIIHLKLFDHKKSGSGVAMYM